MSIQQISEIKETAAFRAKVAYQSAILRGDDIASAKFRAKVVREAVLRNAGLN